MAGVGSDRRETAKIVGKTLKGLVAAGAVGSALTAPGLVGLLEKLLRDNGYKKDVDFYRLATYLKSRRLIESQERPDGSVEVLVTLGGWRRVQKYNLDTMQIRRPDSWDGQWRMVMFDIPEKQKVARNALSIKLKSVGRIFFYYQACLFARQHGYPPGMADAHRRSDILGKEQFFYHQYLGLLQWQRSIWVHPFDCETEVMTVAQVYNIDQYVTYLTFEQSNKNTWLFRNFAHLLPS